jgi:hypothetical protein
MTQANISIFRAGALALIFSVTSIAVSATASGLNKQSLKGQAAWDLWNHYLKKDADWKEMTAERSAAADKNAWDEKFFGDWEKTAFDAMKSKTNIDFDFRGMSKFERSMALMTLVFDDDRPKLKHDRKIIYFAGGTNDNMTFGKYFRKFEIAVDPSKLPETRRDIEYDSTYLAVDGNKLSLVYTGISGAYPLPPIQLTADMSAEQMVTQIKKREEAKKKIRESRILSIDYEMLNAAGAEDLKALKKNDAAGIEYAEFNSRMSRSGNKVEQASIQIIVPPTELKRTKADQNVLIVTRDDRFISASSVDQIKTEDLVGAKAIAVGGPEHLKAIVKRLNADPKLSAIDLFKPAAKSCTPS